MAIKWDEEQRKAVGTVFISPGWALIKEELRRRQGALMNQLAFGADRSADDLARAGITAIEQLIKMEKEIFNPIPEEQPFRIPTVGSVNRY